MKKPGGGSMPIHAIERAIEGIPGKSVPRPLYAGVLTAAALLILPSLLSGCQFKNRNEIELSGYDTISGYYSTQPQEIEFGVKLVDEDSGRTKKGTVNLIPAFLRYVLANPTTLRFNDPIDGIGSVVSKKDMSIGFATYIQDKQGTFGASSQASADLVGCRLTETLSHHGTFSQNPSRDPETNVRGTLSVNYSVSYRLDGDEEDCAPIRARFARCYLEGINCSDAEESVFSAAFLASVFDPIIPSGIMTPSEIERFEEVSYIARYR
jgi:hypothetical protein